MKTTNTDMNVGIQNDDQLGELVREFRAAELNKEKYPAYYAEKAARLKKDWPTLYKLLTEILNLHVTVHEILLR